MSNRSWQILCWNIRGLNDSNKWDVVRSKVEESACVVFCLQETKKQDVDSTFVRNLVWNSSIFLGTVVDK
jgi:exonuclease III